MFRFIDLFAGIGGMRRAFEPYGGKCVFSCEIDKYARQTYEANYTTNHPFATDIRDVIETDIPEHDLLLAGFPCQPFSIAGVSKRESIGQKHGFRDETQGTLFFDIARIIDYCHPKAFLLENVKNLTSHDNGKTFHIIRSTLEDELGYTLSWRVIDAKGFLPQHRERIFILGFREPTSISLDTLPLPSRKNGPNLSTILYPPNVWWTESYTLSDTMWSWLQSHSAKHKALGHGFGFSVVTPDDTARTLTAHYSKDAHEILIHQEGKNPRKLTPRECARLMGFDSSSDFEFSIPVSDTQAYRQFGNSVAVPVVRAIANHIMPYFDPNYVSEYFYSMDESSGYQARLL